MVEPAIVTPNLKKEKEKRDKIIKKKLGRINHMLISAENKPYEEIICQDLSRHYIVVHFGNGDEDD